MPDVIVVIGAGAIGQAIARRVGAGKHVLLADLRRENAAAAGTAGIAWVLRSGPRPFRARLAVRADGRRERVRRSDNSPMFH